MNCLNKFKKRGYEKRLEIRIGENIIKGLSRNYDNVGPRCPLALIGSFGFLEIALNYGNARRHLGIEKGDTVTLKYMQEMHREE